MNWPFQCRLFGAKQKYLTLIVALVRNFFSGTAISYGATITYSKNIYKGFFATVGIGYFKQNFGIRRPFDFNGDTITNFGYYTKKYSYENINWIIGLGYDHELNKNYSLHGGLFFNTLYSIRQKYIPSKLTNYTFKKYQVETNSFFFGQVLNLNVGANKKLSPNLSVGADLVLPVHTKWRKDKIFREPENKFYRSKFSIGTSISFKYNFHN